jgi:hypothetical protein
VKYLSSACASVSFAAAASNSADGISGPITLQKMKAKQHNTTVHVFFYKIYFS